MKTVAIVGFSPVSRSYAPWKDEEITLYGLNEEYSFDWWKRKTGKISWFQLHTRESFTRKDNHNDPHHFSWLKKKHDFPIYMQQHWDDIPSSVAFPKEDINKLFNDWLAPLGATFDNYFTSTLAYLLGFAVLEGFERIEIYGFEMASGTEYARQRMCAAFLIGLLRGHGIDVYVPPVSHLLRGYGAYAYDDTMLGMRQELEFLANKGDAALDNSIIKASERKGKVQILEEASKLHPELIEEAEKTRKKAEALEQAVFIKEGWIKGIRSAMSTYDRYVELDREKETDGTKA